MVAGQLGGKMGELVIQGAVTMEEPLVSSLAKEEARI